MGNMNSTLFLFTVYNYLYNCKQSDTFVGQTVNWCGSPISWNGQSCELTAYYGIMQLTQGDLYTVEDR